MRGAVQVFTGCGKPGFFHAPKPIYEVQTPTGLLANTDGGSPMTAIGDRCPHAGRNRSRPAPLPHQV